MLNATPQPHNQAPMTAVTRLLQLLLGGLQHVAARSRILQWLKIVFHAYTYAHLTFERTAPKSYQVYVCTKVGSLYHKTIKNQTDTASG